MKYYLILLLFSPLFLMAQADSTVLVDQPAYSIKVPEGWSIKEGCKEEYCSMLSPADTVGFMDTYVENINITVNKLSSSKYTALQYTNFSIGYLPKVVNNFEVLDKTKLAYNAYRITYRGEKNNIEQTWRQYYYVKSSKVYIVTFAAQSRKYDYYLPLIEPYLSSFVLK